MFRDPLTITQNMTFPIPPKTTVGGMLAAILGIDYNDYLNDPEFFNFRYSLVLEKPVRKKSFVQNYVANYTKGSEKKFNAIKKYLESGKKQKDLLFEKEQLEEESDLTKKEEKLLGSIGGKIESESMTLEKASASCSKVFNESFTSPKPIFRELLVAPEYLVFIHDFKYEKEILHSLENHFSEFSLYMGNSEFSANYTYVDCEWSLEESERLDSFTLNPSKIVFEEGKKYTNVYMATKAVGQREYRDYKNFILCDKQITLSGKTQVHAIVTKVRSYYCEFV
ncbi:putative CRISPR-associated protein Cas5 [Desulforapulum autotrophicum HRM2]|uniref:CRISPR-associated protein Cas5 n=1 Tax=Desulforapulum autotrophicum (strain ATCC 43914 / DSM 3382 / VKM B-1955 / HRM2) TaxID=177437 RepID=C0QHV7_DESAH|nr:putative CRISPR-associated protein Cas5 [Desulforapulum autotrophicum HRM2]